jgi:hypothetical protein
MTFVSKFARGVTVGALAAGLTLSSVNAQNGTNYHVLGNGADVAYTGIGAGGTQAVTDSIMTHIAGEELKGSHGTLLGDFGYRNPQFREMMCVFNAPIGGGTALWFSALVWIELDGMNGNAPEVFTNPACVPGGPQFPMGASGAVPYGTPPLSTFSFATATVGVNTIVLANEGLVPSSQGGIATLIASAGGISLPINSTGFCWGVQFTWSPSALVSLDDTDGWEHSAVNSPDGNQYWMMSNDELNVWQSWTVGTDSGGIYTLPANIDYAYLSSTTEPSTSVSLAPVGANLTGSYYAQTENVVTETGAPALNLNVGFDVGRGSRVISLNGTSGVANPVTGLGNQNPAAAGKIPTLGLVTWDNGSDGNGSVRLPWLSVDFLGLGSGNPDTDPGVVIGGFGVRVPVVSFGVVQGITSLCFGLFGHVTSAATSGWPDPEGFASGAFGVAAIAGASNQFPTLGLTVCTITPGLPVNVTYGSSGRKDGPGGLTWNPAVADLSDARECFLLD